MDLKLGSILDLNMVQILISYYIIMFVFHFQIDFVLHIDEETFIKIQDLVMKLEFDFHVHIRLMDVMLKVNFFHHKKIYFVIPCCKKNLHYCEHDQNLWILPIIHFYKRWTIFAKLFSKSSFEMYFLSHILFNWNKRKFSLELFFEKLHTHTHTHIYIVKKI
jgi:hypothetical protein